MYAQKTTLVKQPLGQEYLTRYSDINKFAENGGALLLPSEIGVEYLLPFLWRDALKHVELGKDAIQIKANEKTLINPAKKTKRTQRKWQVFRYSYIVFSIFTSTGRI